MKNFMAFVVAALVTLTAATGCLDDLDCKISDRFYQTQGTASSDIIVVGIDSNTLNKRGSLKSSWIRRDIAKAIEIPPAAIGIDFLFTGENSDAPEFDKELVEVAGKYKNVVTASAAIVPEDVLQNHSNDPHEIFRRSPRWLKRPKPVTSASLVTTTEFCADNFFT